MSRKLRALAFADLEQLDRPCSSCCFWESANRLERICRAACDTHSQRAWFDRVTSEWGACGRVAVADGEPLGFVKYAPSRYFPQAWNLAVAPTDPQVPLIACLHVSADARNRGLGTLLLRDALKDLLTRGERLVEAYAAARPVEDPASSPFMPLDFLQRNGFVIVGADPEYPLLQLELRSLATWSENLETVFDSLKIPLRVPRHQPTPW